MFDYFFEIRDVSDEIGVEIIIVESCLEVGVLSVFELRVKGV